MLFWTTVKVGLKSLLANKMRSFLAMLGIIIGVGGVIAMMAVTDGAKQATLARLSAMGSRLLWIYPRQISYMGVSSGPAQNLTLADAKALLEQVEGIRRLSPAVSRNAQAKCGGRNTVTNIRGVAQTYLPIRDFQIEAGRCFTDQEADNMARVCVLGAMTAEALFAADDPLEQPVKISGVNYRVIGVLKAKGSQGHFNPDDQILIPYTTAMKQVVGRGAVRGDSIQEINIQGSPTVDLKALEDRITELLRRRHRIEEGGENDFWVRNQADWIALSNQQLQLFTMLLGSIASISLLVGGIGIMNIMLVSVTERTREIGVRKAIGAKEASIMWQFLLESIVISLVGGLIGVAAGIATAKVIGHLVEELPTAIEPFGSLLALSFSAIVGVVFGSYPAWRAARLDPVDALRYE